MLDDMLLSADKCVNGGIVDAGQDLAAPLLIVGTGIIGRSHHKRGLRTLVANSPFPKGRAEKRPGRVVQTPHTASPRT